MMLIDTNVLMYAAGAAHPNKAPSTRMLERVAHGALAATIDAETLQEILHRYRAIGQWNASRQVFDLARQLFPSVVPISAEMLDRARTLLDDYPALMARDALHAAVVMHEGFDAICSYDRDFDAITATTRIEP
ncbi:type II toxin-antitoxin system VapC family toxin [Gemmatimonas sp.]|uniref:type II toxin-antitoxin system VapC family toxin n=1 Tax=Gemmatimonas sp. TaxID=1962908 RepID=UPI0035630978